MRELSDSLECIRRAALRARPKTFLNRWSECRLQFSAFIASGDPSRYLEDNSWLLAIVRNAKTHKDEVRFMWLAMSLSAVLVATNILVHYETLRFLSAYVPMLPIFVRAKVLVVVLGCFSAHTVEVWLYAFAYLLMHKAGIGSLRGQVSESFADFLYFSASSYSTLGLGDVYPIGALRLISGVESINGLFLVAWSTSFTYFVMDRLWPLHPDKSDKK
jgi:hypothetical protein